MWPRHLVFDYGTHPIDPRSCKDCRPRQSLWLLRLHVFHEFLFLLEEKRHIPEPGNRGIATKLAGHEAFNFCSSNGINNNLLLGNIGRCKRRNHSILTGEDFDERIEAVVRLDNTSTKEAVVDYVG